MGARIKQSDEEAFAVEKHERLKTLFLAGTIFLIIGAYTVTRDLKNAIFISIVGKEYIPWAKIFSMIILIPGILLYARFVDTMRRYQLLCFYSLLFGIASLIFTFYIGHPYIGISNTDTNPYRLFGWFFYFFVEGYSPFVLSVFWAFANSVTGPEEAKKTYGFIVSGSKLGGMLSAGIAWMIFNWSAQASSQDFFSEITAHQTIMAVSSLMLLLVPVLVLFMIKKVPGQYLHGYEAVYKMEKKKKIKKKVGILAGLKVFIKYPYVLGIFGMVFFYEVIATVLSYLRLGIVQSHAESISDVSKVLFEMVFKTHAAGFVISFFGTGTLLKKLGTRICLLLVPLIIGALLLYLMFETTPQALINAFVIFKAVHYAFNWPVRESLYIPTVKEIKFKSKSWIDAFGSKFAKTSGSAFNIVSTNLGSSLFLSIHSFFFAGIIGLWFVTAFLLGRKFERAVVNNKVIGIEE